LISLVKIKKSPDRFKGSWLAIGGVAISVISLIASALVAVKMRDVLEEVGKAESERVKTAFELAEDNIRTKKGDQIGFGNTDQAKALATSLGERMKALRDAAFIVHVPQFRKFDDEAKVALNYFAGGRLTSEVESDASNQGRF
jgi:hypothetical protein